MSVYKRLQRWRHWLFPSFCALCQRALAEAADFCDGCAADLPVLAHACGCCAAPFDSADLHGSLCGACQQRTPAYARVRAPFRYGAPIDRLILAGKYGGRLDWLALLGRRLARHVKAEAPAVDLIVPMPLHRSRLRSRGYNQSLELARPVARALGLPVRRDLARLRATPPQAELSREERRKNVRDAFAANPRVAGLRVALIDDVMTSGATAEMAARCLRRAGAASVEVWVVARA